MQTYFNSIKTLYNQHQHPENAIAMAKYMRNLFPFLGIKKPLRTELTKQFWKKNGLAKIEDLDQFIRLCWAAEAREFQYLAIDTLKKMQKKLLPEQLELLEELIIKKSWWDSVDLLAGIVGKLFLKYPDLQLKTTDRWIASDNIWLQRTALLFQLHYKEKTNEDLLFRYVLSKKASKEFFIQKAMGWALRQHTRIDPIGVETFVSNNDLPALTKREALKLLKK